MIRKSLAVVATSALILAGTTATASAQSAAPYPSSQIPVDQGIVQTIQDFAPGAPADQIHAGLQIGAAWGAWVLGGIALSTLSSVTGVGSAVLAGGSVR